MAKTQKERAQDIIKLYHATNGSYRQEWKEDNQKGYDFYLGDQLTADEEARLEEAGMPTFVVNHTTPLIELMRYFATAKNPRWNAVGSESSDIDIAHVHSSIVEYDWTESNGQKVYGDVVLNALTKSKGYFLITQEPSDYDGSMEVRFQSVDPFEVLVDPQSSDFLEEDAGYKLVRKVFPRQTLMHLLPEYKNKIKKAQPSESYPISQSLRNTSSSRNIQKEDIFDAYTDEGMEDELIDYYEMYTKERLKYYAVWTRKQFTPDERARIQKIVDAELQEFTQETAVQLEERKAQIAQELEAGEIIPERAELEHQRAKKMAEQAIAQQEQLLKSQVQDEFTQVEMSVLSEDEYDAFAKRDDFKDIRVDEQEFYRTRVKVTRTVGGETFLEEEFLPTDKYPLVPMPYNHTGTPYPMSAVLPLIGKQQEINKAHQVMIHNANLSSNLRWLYQEGQIDEDWWEAYSSSPGALLKYRDVAGGDPPQAIQPLPLNNAFYTITQQGKEDMEYISGMYSSMQGDVSAQHDTYKGLLAQDEFGTRRIRAWMDNIVEPVLQHVGEVHQDIAQNTYTYNKVFEIVQPETSEKTETEINIPIYNDYGTAIEQYQRDYQSAEFDVVIVPGSTMPVNRWALTNEYYKWAVEGLIDDIAFLEQADIPNKERIIKRKSRLAQALQRIESQEEEKEKLEGIIQTLQRQLVQMGVKDKQRQVESRMERSAMRKESADRTDRKEAQLQIDTAVDKALNELEKHKEVAKAKQADEE